MTKQHKAVTKHHRRNAYNKRLKKALTARAINSIAEKNHTSITAAVKILIDRTKSTIRVPSMRKKIPIN